MQNTFIVCHFCWISFAWHVLPWILSMKPFTFVFSFLFLLTFFSSPASFWFDWWFGVACNLTLSFELKVQLFGFIEQFWFYDRIGIAIAHRYTFQIGWLYTALKERKRERHRLGKEVIINDGNGMVLWIRCFIDERAIEKWCSLFSIFVDLRLH